MAILKNDGLSNSNKVPLTLALKEISLLEMIKREKTPKTETLTTIRV